jgi:hypothetical protein
VEPEPVRLAAHGLVGRRQSVRQQVSGFVGALACGDPKQERADRAVPRPGGLAEQRQGWLDAAQVAKRGEAGIPYRGIVRTQLARVIAQHQGRATAFQAGQGVSQAAPAAGVGRVERDGASRREGRPPELPGAHARCHRRSQLGVQV